MKSFFPKQSPTGLGDCLGQLSSIRWLSNVFPLSISASPFDKAEEESTGELRINKGFHLRSDTFAHIPFTKASHMATSNFKRGENYNPTMCLEGKAPAVLVSSTNTYHSEELVDPI